MAPFYSRIKLPIKVLCLLNVLSSNQIQIQQCHFKTGESKCLQILRCVGHVIYYFSHSLTVFQCIWFKRYITEPPWLPFLNANLESEKRMCWSSLELLNMKIFLFPPSELHLQHPPGLCLPRRGASSS